MIPFFRAHRRLITFLLVAFCAFRLTPSWSEVGLFGFLFFFALFVMLIVSQIFWVGRVVDLWGAIHPRKAAPRLAYGHCECCLSVLLLLQHRALHQPLGNPAGRFDPFDGAPRSI